MVHKRDNPSDEQIIKLLLSRLERISADSYWAHRASGTRGSLLNALEACQQGRAIDPDSLDYLINLSFSILERAAAEMTKDNVGVFIVRTQPPGSVKAL